uniref:FoP_duplication domain-containing protein n=1 Tax=Steinernema glaseri TaxID=37863 RepID=A0A1I7XYC8_9BILA
MSLHERFSRMKSVVERPPVRSAPVFNGNAHMDVDLREEPALNPRGRSFLYDDYMDNDLNSDGLTPQAQARITTEREQLRVQSSRAGYSGHVGPSRPRVMINRVAPRGYVDLDNTDGGDAYYDDVPQDVEYVMEERPRIRTRYVDVVRPRPRPRQVVTEVVEVVRPQKPRYISREKIIQHKQRSVPIEQRLSVVKKPMSKRIAPVVKSPAARSSTFVKKSSVPMKANTGRIIKKKMPPKPAPKSKTKTVEKKKPLTKEELDKELEEYMRKSNHPRIDVSDLK